MPGVSTCVQPCQLANSKAEDMLSGDMGSGHLHIAIKKPKARGGQNCCSDMGCVIGSIVPTLW